MNFEAIRDEYFGNENSANELSKEDFIILDEKDAAFLVDKCSNFNKKAFLKGLRRQSNLILFFNLFLLVLII